MGHVSCSQYMALWAATEPEQWFYDYKDMTSILTKENDFQMLVEAP